MRQRKSVLNALSGGLESSIGAGFHVKAVILHGSLLWSPRPEDVDLLVVPDQGFSEKSEVELMAVVEEATDLPVDVHVVDVDDPDCFIVEEALSHGIIIYLPFEHVAELVRIALLCWDYMLARRKIGYTETVVRRALERGST